MKKITFQRHNTMKNNGKIQKIEEENLKQMIEYTKHKQKQNHLQIHQHKDTHKKKHKKTELYQVLLEEPTMKNT